jgi:hypothetical protein
MLKQLKLYYVLISIPYALMLGGAVVFLGAINSTLESNPHPQINYTIFFITLGGGLIILFNSRRFVREARALVEFSKAVKANTDLTTLKDLTKSFTCDVACLLQILAYTGDRAISHQEQASIEHELANVVSRLNRRNALPQYLIGLLVGMGLLGTFIGLLATLGDIGALIGSFADLDMSNSDPIVVFGAMIERMKAPMASMAIAFSASLFGLLGSIILGLMMVGIRRLQSDIFSLLSAETAHHIETALSFESVSFRDPEAIGMAGETGEFTAKILLRIEERLAETGRLRQRSLSAEIDDFKTQRGEMLQVLIEQTESSNSFRGELQQLGSQLGTIFNGMEQRNSEISSQISDLTVSLSGDAKETHKLLATQVDEQKRLLDTLGSYNIDERLAESARAQQRALNSVIEDFKHQREEMLQTLADQTEASNNFRGELQQLGGQLGTIFNSMEKGNNEISGQLSELTVHMGADAKESHRLLNVTSSNVRGELQQLGNQLGERLGSLTSSTEQGTGAICSQVSELQTQLVADNEKSQQQLDTLSNAAEQGAESICNRIAELMGQLTEGTEASGQLLDSAGHTVRGELQLLGKQLGTIFQVMEQGSGELASQISELMHHRSSDAKESHELLARLLSAYTTEQLSEQES